MTAENPFDVPYGYQFQDGDDWDFRPAFVSGEYWVAFAADGSRRMVDWERIVTSAGRVGQLLYDRQPGLPIHYCRDTFPPNEGDTRYIGYDWRRTNDSEPVNQIPLLLRIREHAARFSHQLDAALGHNSLQSASEEDRLVTFQTLSAMIGSAWRRYAVLAAIDPEEIIHGGNFDGTPLWKRNLDEYEAIDVALCGQCNIATYGRRFYFHANLALFRRLYRSGIVYAVDRSVTPWGATLFDVATQPESEFYVELDRDYHDSLAYYDNVVGAAEHE